MIANDRSPFCYTMTPEPNDPSRAGQPAGLAVRFGAFRRFCVVSVPPRFSSVVWFGYDRDRGDDHDSPLCCCVALSLEEAQEAFAFLKARAPHMFSERLSVGEQDR